MILVFQTDDDISEIGARAGQNLVVNVEERTVYITQEVDADVAFALLARIAYSLRPLSVPIPDEAVAPLFRSLAPLAPPPRRRRRAQMPANPPNLRIVNGGAR